MIYTYSIIERLEEVADKIVALNPGLVEKVPNEGLRKPPYLISKVSISKLEIPYGWVYSENRIISKSTLIYIEVKMSK